MRIKVLMVDLDGVIRRWEKQDGQIEPLYDLPRGAILKIAFSPYLLPLAVTGQITDEEWRQRVAERLEREFPSTKAREAVLEWSRLVGDVDWETVSIIKRCYPSTRRVLITNATTRLERDLLELGLSDAFDVVVNSSAVGVAKPDHRIYEIALQQTGSTPSEALFVDDTERHVRAAEELGIIGHVFSTHEMLRDFLRQFGILPLSAGV